MKRVAIAFRRSSGVVCLETERNRLEPEYGIVPSPPTGTCSRSSAPLSSGLREDAVEKLKQGPGQASLRARYGWLPLGQCHPSADDLHRAPRDP
jgi:hypothetical protein